MSLNGIPLQKNSPNWFSANPMSANISPILEAGVGAYFRSASIAAWPSFRTRLALRKIVGRKLLVVWTVRKSVVFRCSKVSPERHSSARRPPRRKKPSGASPEPSKAWLKRRMTPFLSATAPAAEPASVTMSGSLTWRMLSHAPVPSARPSARPPAHRRAARVVGEMVIASPCRVKAMGVVASEPDVDPEGVIGGRRRGLEVALDADVVAEIAAFGVDAGVAGHDAQVSPRRREADLVGGEIVGPLVRQVVGDRQLAQPEQVGLLDVAVLGGAGVHPHRDGAGLLRERRRGVHVALAVEPVLAADPLGPVELVAAQLGVGQGSDLELLAEQADGAVGRELGGRERRADEDVGVADEELPDRGGGIALDDPVAVLVLVGEGAQPPPLDRVALDVRVGGADVGWKPPEAHDLVAIVRAAGGELPADVLAVEDDRVDGCPDARVPDLADVDDLGRPGPRRRRDGPADQRVLAGLVVVGELEVDPVPGQGGIEP